MSHKIKSALKDELNIQVEMKTRFLQFVFHQNQFFRLFGNMGFKKELMSMYIVECMFLFLFFQSCITFDEIKYVNLEPIVAIEELNDSTFFRDIPFIKEYDGCVYAVDNTNGRILILDINLNLQRTIGNRGLGPGEFNWMGDFAVYKDTLLAIDAGKLNTFTIDGEFIESYSFSNDQSLAYENFCINKEGDLLFTSTLDSFPVVKYDRKMNRLFGFGEWIEPYNKESRRFLNNYLIACLNDKIITVQKDAPVINIYETNGNHILKKRLPEHLFEKRLNFKRHEQERDASNLRKIYMLFYSIACVDNKIYISYIDHNEDNNRPYLKKIVELIYENDDITIEHVYSLSKEDRGWFASFYVTKQDKIIAVNSSMQTDPYISVYQLK